MTLKRTPLFDVYKEYQAKTIDFGGWELPVHFSRIKEEHEAIRTRAGLFDVSHMGELEVKGAGSLAFLQKMMTNDVSKLTIGGAQYTAMCYENGGTVDDLIIYKLEEQRYLLVVNAANVEKDYKWLNQHLVGDVELVNVSHEFAQLALQGPFAQQVLQKLVAEVDLSSIGFFRFHPEIVLNGKPALVSRTGYTGEDGFEIYCHPVDSISIWNAIMNAGKELGVLPCGLGARDTLRFEATLPLYGQELSSTISPLEAGIGFAVNFKKEDFIGKEALSNQRQQGLSRKISGIEMIDRGIPRHGYQIYKNGNKIGEVTTGTQSPTLNKNIGLALLETPFTDIGTEIEVEVRGKRLRAVVVPLPFYKKQKQ